VISMQFMQKGRSLAVIVTHIYLCSWVGGGGCFQVGRPSDTGPGQAAHSGGAVSDSSMLAISLTRAMYRPAAASHAQGYASL